jgi:hypothetical protein
MPTPDHGDAITAALLMVSQHAERLAALDEREAGHHRQLGEGLAELGRLAAESAARVDGVQVTVARQTAILDTLDGLDRHVAALADRLTNMRVAHGEGREDNGEHNYGPAPAARWWKLDGDEREQAIIRLRAWVEQVYRPGYGHLATALGGCWEQHPLCLYGLDWLMELWSVLYLTPERSTLILASQAEWQTRLLPGLAEQMHIETTRCQHGRTAPPNVIHP